MCHLVGAACERSVGRIEWRGTVAETGGRVGDPPATRSNRFASIDSVSRLHEHGESGGAVAGVVNGVGVLACGMVTWHVTGHVTWHVTGHASGLGRDAALPGSACTTLRRPGSARPFGGWRASQAAPWASRTRSSPAFRAAWCGPRACASRHPTRTSRRGRPCGGGILRFGTAWPRLALLASILCAFVPSSACGAGVHLSSAFGAGVHPSSACGAGVHLDWPRAAMPAPILPLGWIILVDLRAAGARELTDR
jgi:hypothetical protein